MTMAYSQLKRVTGKHGPSLDNWAQMRLKRLVAIAKRRKVIHTTWPKHSRMRKAPGPWTRKRGLAR